VPVHNLITYRDFSDANMNRFTNSLFLEDWANVLNCNDPNESLNNFMTSFKSKHNEFFSPKTKRFNKNVNKKEKWMTTGLLISRLKKLELSKICSLSPSAVNTNRYKQYRNLYNKTVRLSCKLYYNDELLINKNNLKKTWQILNEALNLSSNRQKISKLMVNNTLIDNPTEMANKFNNYYVHC
jgi:hypothetical protein